jgi:hypothetical protein
MNIQLSAAITARPGVEVYHIANEDGIDMALLTNLETPCRLMFIGRDAKQLADLYGGVWIPDGPNVEADLLRLWGLPQNN